MKEIAKIPGIAGVKESSGDINQMGDVIREIAIPRKNSSEKFWVLSGDDALILPLTCMGGDGVISVVSNLLPAKVKALTKAAIDGDYEKARSLHYERLPFIKAAFVETNPVPIKQALSWAGLPSGPARLPMGKMSPASEAVLKKALVDLGIIK
jgi:4-hydroxy-tetrahydrodipicolinate synthase